VHKSRWQLAVPPDAAKLTAEAIDRLDRLPVMDRAVQQVLAVTDNEDSGLDELVAALEADLALAVNLLRYANSAYLGSPIPAKTIRQAVVMIGREATRELCLEAVTFRFFELAPGNGGISRGQMHTHAVTVASLASAAAEMASVPAGLPHLAGLLHDCGKLVMPVAFGEQTMDDLAALHPSGAARSQAEWEQLGIDHAYAGAMFAADSGLDEQVVAAIAWHHGGRRGCVAPTPEIACVQLANAVVDMLSGELPDEALLDSALSTLGLAPDALDTLAERLSALARNDGKDLGERIAKLEQLANTDELTGLANRRHWMSTVRQKITSGAQGNVLLCDLDNFKDVNDTHGHAAGDLLLVEVSRILTRHGLAGRVGGDEFALWVSGDGATAVANRIVDEVAAAFGSDHAVGVSVGVAPTARDLADALEYADRALYAAKATGRGRASRFAEELTA
jgi:diguanylate cyclase (GGDEF)-like protein/putative nucleotidyltransferase with HDIG domain